VRLTALSGVLCPKCKWADFFKAQVCPRCLTSLADSSFPGQGRIVTFTVIRHPPIGFEDQAPYVVAIIDLKDGPKVVGRVNNKPEEVKIGAEVEFARQAAGALEFTLS